MKNKKGLGRAISLKCDGFSLMEILVVLAIIAILTTISIFGYQNAGKKTRDAMRLNDIQQIEKAIKLFQAEKGHVPCETNAFYSIDYFDQGYIDESHDIATLLQPYFPGENIPTDPKHHTSGPDQAEDYFYGYDAWHDCNPSGTGAFLEIYNFETQEYKDKYGNLDEFCSTSYDVQPKDVGDPDHDQPDYVIYFPEGC